MCNKSLLTCCLLASALLICSNTWEVAEGVGVQKPTGVWTDPEDKALPEDFKIQGEFVGEIKGGIKLGAQVIALDKGTFQAVVYPGGLPGDGWDGQQKILLDGKREGDKAAFTPAAGKRKYMAAKAEDFAATAKFPPPGHKPYTALIAGGVLTGKTEMGQFFELTKTVRQSPTLKRPAPAGALVLFDGKNTDAFDRGRVDPKLGALNTDGKDVKTKRKFDNFTLHVEFMLPFKPGARGQSRANSGLYLLDLYEVQILDSFGLEGKNNECGAIYQRFAPKVNMCLPPLQWQAYDIDFTNAVLDPQGKKVKNTRITVQLNGVTVHDDAEIPAPTGFGLTRADAEGLPGILCLQGHNNAVQFRNIWIVERK